MTNSSLLSRKYLPITLCALLFLSACGETNKENNASKIDDSHTNTDIHNTDNSAPEIVNVDYDKSILEILSIGSKDITDTSVKITWDLNAYATGYVKYGTSNSYGQETIRETSFKYNSHTQGISNLLPNTTYHYQIVSVSVSGATVISADRIFKTSVASVSPEESFALISINPTSITDNSAKITWHLNQYATGYVKYGMTNSYGQETQKETSFNYKSHTQSISGLLANTTYHYQIISIDKDGETVISTDNVFKTSIAAAVAEDFLLISIDDTDIGKDSAKITWNLNDYATGYIKYGTTNIYDQETIRETSFIYKSHTQQLKNLLSNTTYHYQIVSANANGDLITSADKTFKTTSTLEDIMDSTLNMGGIFFGNPVAGEHTGNGQLFTHQASRRFRAERTGFVNGVRYNNRTLTQANINNRCDANSDSVWCRCVNAGLDEYTCGYHLGNSYSVGNGGSIMIEIQADDGSAEHLPTGIALAKITSAFTPLDNADAQYPKFDFITPAELQAGSIYHIVYKQLNPPDCTPRRQSTSNALNCDRDKGAVGLNGIHFRNISDAAHRFGPWHGDTAAILTQQEANGEWTLNKNNLSWFEVRYTDDVWIGDSVARYNSDVDNEENTAKGGRKFGAIKQVRQKFTVSKKSRHIDGIWIYARKLLSNAENINVKLARENGTVIANTILQASDFELCSDACSRWVYADMPSTILEDGKTYTLTLSTDKSNSYHIGTGFPLDYGSYQSTAKNVWKDASAEYSSNSGASWNGFSGNYKAKRDLGLLFTIEGKPRFLP